MAKRNARKIALSVFVLGFSLLVVGIAWLLMERSLVSVPDGSSIANVDLAEGEVILSRKSTLLEFNPKFGEKIYSGDKIKTGPKSALILTTQNASQIRIDENSIAVVERSKEKDLITVLAGQAQAIKHGASLEIHNTHEKWRSAHFSTQINRQEIAQKPTAKTPPPPMPGPATEVAAENSNDEQNLKSTLDGQKTYFNRCFAKFLVQNPEARGEIVLGFLLFPQGKAEKVKILSSSLKDNDLEKCLTSVVERSPFKRFAGEPISVTYPIRFE